MTLSQLRTFALVARTGSMRAAAAALGVSEPAVSAAIAALRTDLDDPLVVRAGGGIRLTAGGRRLAAHADEIVGLADRARREVAAAGTARDILRVVVTPAFEEHAATALVDAFTRRSPGTSVELGHEAASALASCLVDRSADVVLGLRPPTVAGGGLDVVPFLRYHRVVVAQAGHRLAGAPVPPSALAGERWLAGPAGIEETSDEGRWVARWDDPPDVVRLASEADAVAATAAGQGVTLALGHVVRDRLRRGELVRLTVTGTPLHGLWYASTLGRRRGSSEAVALQRFTTTPDAMAAMAAPGGRVRQGRPAPSVHVTLWS